MDCCAFSRATPRPQFGAGIYAHNGEELRIQTEFDELRNGEGLRGFTVCIHCRRRFLFDGFIYSGHRLHPRIYSCCRGIRVAGALVQPNIQNNGTQLPKTNEVWNKQSHLQTIRNVHSGRSGHASPHPGLACSDIRLSIES